MQALRDEAAALEQQLAEAQTEAADPEVDREKQRLADEMKAIEEQLALQRGGGGGGGGGASASARKQQRAH
jgi:hypothetical protein